MNIRRPLSIALLVVAGLALATAQPSTQARRSSDIPQLTFEKITLPNGLDVILSPKRGLPMVAVNLWYHVGPAFEAKGRTGFAHLFEHMMFQSSLPRPETRTSSCSSRRAPATSTAPPTSIAPTTSRRCRRISSSSRSGSSPIAWATCSRR
jgi:predicted Zn-dependent peptidase